MCVGLEEVLNIREALNLKFLRLLLYNLSERDRSRDGGLEMSAERLAGCSLNQVCLESGCACWRDLWKAEKRLLGHSMRGPLGRMVPLSFTQCRYPLVMSAMPMARAEQYRNL